MITRGPDIPAYVFVGDGFLVAQAVTTDGGSALRITHIDENLAITHTSFIANVPSSTPQLAWTGTEATLIYSGTANVDGATVSIPLWQRLDRHGALIGNPVDASSIGAIREILPVSQGIAVSLSGATVAMTVVDTNGAPVIARFPVSTNSASKARIVGQGNDVVFGWFNDATHDAPYSFLTFARVNPR